MSFSITAVGTVEQVRAQLAKQHGDHTASYTGDRSQYERAYAMITAELGDWPTSGHPSQTLGLHVTASGHHDQYTRSISIELRPVWFPNVEE